MMKTQRCKEKYTDKRTAELLLVGYLQVRYVPSYIMKIVVTHMWFKLVTWSYSRSATLSSYLATYHLCNNV